MPPRKKQAPQAPSTMKELKDTLWKAADKLRGSLSASQYKDVILGLVFLKYVSDAYDRLCAHAGAVCGYARGRGRRRADRREDGPVVEGVAGGVR